MDTRLPTKAEASALADLINTDPRNDGCYDAHGLNRDELGWYAVVNDCQGTRKNPSGRALDIRSEADWMAALASR